MQCGYKVNDEYTNGYVLIQTQYPIINQTAKNYIASNAVAKWYKTQKADLPLNKLSNIISNYIDHTERPAI